MSFILADLNLPPENAESICASCRDKKLTIPTVLTSGSPDPTTPERARSLGAHFLPRPSHNDLLVNLVRRVEGLHEIAKTSRFLWETIIKAGEIFWKINKGPQAVAFEFNRMYKEKVGDALAAIAHERNISVEAVPALLDEHELGQESRSALITLGFWMEDYK